MNIRFLVLARNDDMVILFIQTKEQKNIRIQIMPIRLFVQKQASAHTSECPSWQKKIAVQSTVFLKEAKERIFCSS